MADDTLGMGGQHQRPLGACLGETDSNDDLAVISGNTWIGFLGIVEKIAEIKTWLSRRRFDSLSHSTRNLSLLSLFEK